MACHLLINKNNKPESNNDQGVSSTVLLAEEIAINAHAGQYRRDGKTPYINHPRKVVNRVSTEKEKAVAWLHDILEDTEITEESLSVEGLPDDIIIAVKIMTHQKRQSYKDYLERVKQNPVSKTVKIADMLANLSDTPTEKQIKKYAKGLLYLLG